MIHMNNSSPRIHYIIFILYVCNITISKSPHSQEPAKILVVTIITEMITKEIKEKQARAR